VIVGIASVKNEAGIIAKTISHTLAAGADHLVISDGWSTDGTAEIVGEFPEVTLLAQVGSFDQPIETLRLTHFAQSLGATWIVPFDADEFWCDLTPLNDLPHEYSKVYATVYGHTDWNLRHAEPRGLPKVAFRDAVSVSWGNHEAETGPGRAASGFEIRELQYQSFDHFLAKIAKSRELYESYAFPEVYGSHMRALVAMSDTQREAEWARLQAIPTVFDPIPYRGAR
jgi:hypothetical protein